MHVREPNGSDDVRSVKGSTRLEAKKQRRREGRETGRRRPPIVTESEFLARRESVERSMVVRQRNDRTQIAVLEDGVLVEHYVNRSSHQSYVGNVYLGRVHRVLPGMHAAFVAIGFSDGSVQSFDDRVLALLDKGHTRADFLRHVAAIGRAGHHRAGLHRVVRLHDEHVLALLAALHRLRWHHDRAHALPARHRQHRKRALRQRLAERRELDGWEGLLFVREAAAWALYTIRDPDAVSAIEAAMREALGGISMAREWWPGGRADASSCSLPRRRFPPAAGTS